MNWREAFLRQAQSDFAVLERLNSSEVETCHRLHYLQMTGEKLAKSLMTQASAPPEESHAVLVRMLQTLKGRIDVRLFLGFPGAVLFKQYINSLLPIARKIELLAPALAQRDEPNAEYPWRDKPTHEVIPPCDFSFPGLEPSNAQMAKIANLLRRLLTFRG